LGLDVPVASVKPRVGLTYPCFLRINKYFHIVIIINHIVLLPCRQDVEDFHPDESKTRRGELIFALMDKLTAAMLHNEMGILRYIYFLI